MNYSLLPAQKTYSMLLYPFFLPYFTYVGLGATAEYLSPSFLYLLKLVFTLAVLLYFWKNYSFGKCSLKDIFLSFITTPLWLILWIAPIYIILKLSNTPLPQGKLTAIPSSELYWWLHLITSTTLVAIFEELFCRAYLLEYLYQSGQKTQLSTINKLNQTIDQKPQELAQLPFSKFSFILTLCFFTMGHNYIEYISCILYFSGTCLLYKYTRSFMSCILTHAFTNLAIALLVKFAGMEFLWF